MKQRLLVRVLSPGPPHRQHDTVERSRVVLEKPHPLLTYFVCGLMALGRKSGLEWLETCRDFSITGLQGKFLQRIFTDCVDDLAVDLRQRKCLSTCAQLSLNWPESKLKVEIAVQGHCS